MSINLYQFNQVFSFFLAKPEIVRIPLRQFLESRSGRFASHLHKNASCHLAVAIAYSELSSLRVGELN